MTLSTLIRCHHAFAFFGGWPHRILYDKMRQVVVGPERINAARWSCSHFLGRLFEPEIAARRQRVVETCVHFVGLPCGPSG